MSSEAERAREWLSLGCVAGVGPVLGRRLAGALGGPGQVLAAGRSVLQTLGVSAQVMAALADRREADLAGVEAWLAIWTIKNLQTSIFRAMARGRRHAICPMPLTTEISILTTTSSSGPAESLAA